MRKLIGTVTILFVIYLGFFGCEKYNVKPFILDWFRSEKSEPFKEKVGEISEKVYEKGKEVVKEQTDSVIGKIVD